MIRYSETDASVPPTRCETRKTGSKNVKTFKNRIYKLRIAEKLSEILYLPGIPGRTDLHYCQRSPVGRWDCIRDEIAGTQQHRSFPIPPDLPQTMVPFIIIPPNHNPV